MAPVAALTAHEQAAVANRSGAGIDVPWPGLRHSPWPFGGAPNGSLLVWESPEVANALIMWQQPHPIFLAELQRRAANASGGPAAAMDVVRALGAIVIASADHLAGGGDAQLPGRLYFHESDGAHGRYWIGPPVMGGQECGSVQATYNPTFELVYTGYTLDIAQEWRAYLGMPPSAQYDAVASSLAALHVDPASPPGAPLYTFDRDCVCQFLPGDTQNESCRPEMIPPGGSNCPALREHPLQLGIFGMINGRARGDRYGVDLATANNTLRAVWAHWSEWAGTWGWDDSLLAQAMARSGWDPRTIVTGPLLDSKFPYYVNGHTLCCPTYLPGNGGLLLSIAMLAAGSPSSPANNFPPEWHVLSEGFDVPFP